MIISEDNLFGEHICDARDTKLLIHGICSDHEAKPLKFTYKLVLVSFHNIRSSTYDLSGKYGTLLTKTSSANREVLST